jgi:hypothetical protein
MADAVAGAAWADEGQRRAQSIGGAPRFCNSAFAWLNGRLSRKLSG